MSGGFVAASKRIVLTLAAWVLGLAILFLGISIATVGPFGGAIVIVAAALVLPPGRWGSRRLFGRVPSARAIGWIVVPLVVMGTAIAIPAINRNAEALRAAKETAEVADLQSRLAGAKAEVRALITGRRWEEASTLAASFDRLGDSDMSSLASEAKNGIEAARREARKRELVAKLTTTDREALADLIAVRHELAELDPGDPTHARIERELIEKLRARTIAEVAAEKARAASVAAEAERQRRSAEGLVWRKSTHRDAMSGKDVVSTRVRSADTFTFGFPYAGAQRATLEVRNHPRWGRSVMLSIERGQFVCSSFVPCETKIRFDDGPIEEWRLTTPSDDSTDLRFIADDGRFVALLRRARTVRIEAAFYQEGTRTFVFDVTGYE